METYLITNLTKNEYPETTFENIEQIFNSLSHDKRTKKYKQAKRILNDIVNRDKVTWYGWTPTHALNLVRKYIIDILFINNNCKNIEE